MKWEWFESWTRTEKFQLSILTTNHFDLAKFDDFEFFEVFEFSKFLKIFENNFLELSNFGIWKTWNMKNKLEINSGVKGVFRGLECFLQYHGTLRDLRTRPELEH